MAMDNIDNAARQLAFGRIMRMASRQEQPGDGAEYERCRAIIIGGQELPVNRSPNYARDYGK